MRRELAQLVSEMAAGGRVSAVSALIGDAERPLAQALAGYCDRSSASPLLRHHRFDLASLTKPWAATLALALDRRGVVPLDLAVGEIWPQAPAALASQRLEALLRHRSGLEAWRPLYRELRSSKRVVERLLRADLMGAAKPTYSDLGYILWARSVERLTGDSLETLLRRCVLRPLGLSTVEVGAPARRSVASELGNEREVELAAALGVRVGLRGGPDRGKAQDGNARFLGGLPGHAGLFAPATALWRLGAEWLRPRRLLDAHGVAAALGGRGSHALGWWRRRAAPVSARGLSAGGFGHHGFTGTSLWIDPRRERVAVLLAHRVAVDVDLDPWRQRFHELAMS